MSEDVGEFPSWAVKKVRRREEDPPDGGGMRSLYKRSILQAIGGMVENVIKIDLQTDKGTRGQSAKFAVQKVDKIENGLGDTKEPIRSDQQKSLRLVQERVGNERYGEWMAMDRQNRRQSRRNADGLEGGKGNIVPSLD
ncbi:hypothetical protein J1N35_024521 [Gossypium stocksii]|uniref:Uncharacterized protein n=1 Tax=Gossypium stocksii TaxID=47602 RepID=A0A9D3V7K8_9ROSI|nr:hypothetical protein J1N35_024521 [Gossypium stocksii]